MQQMHRYNTVRLEGPLIVLKTEITALGVSHNIPKVLFTVTTDTMEIGSCHTISVYGQLALEVIAFSSVWSGSDYDDEGLNVSLVGRLQTVKGNTRIIGERVIFHVHPKVRQEAVAKLKQLEAQHGYDGRNGYIQTDSIAWE